MTLLHPLVNSRKKGRLLPVSTLTRAPFLPHVPGVLLLLSSFCFENCLIHSFRVHLSMTNSVSVTLSETVSILSPFLKDIFTECKMMLGWLFFPFSSLKMLCASFWPLWFLRTSLSSKLVFLSRWGNVDLLLISRYCLCL